MTEETGRECAPGLPPLEPAIRRLRPLEPPNFLLSCPRCEQDLGEYRFEPLARRAFDEHLDENHPAPTPLDLVWAAVVLTAGDPGFWACEVGGGSYAVRLVAAGQFAVDAVTLGGTVRNPMRSLAEAQICIGSMARVISPAVAQAAALQLRREERVALQ